jgi:hypothetical protein
MWRMGARRRLGEESDGTENDSGDTRTGDEGRSAGGGGGAGRGGGGGGGSALAAS